MSSNPQVIGHGYFELKDPDKESVDAVKAILERPCIVGAVYVLGPVLGNEVLYGFLVMGRYATDKEHDEVYEDLGSYCRVRPLYAPKARMIMKCKGKRMVKITEAEMEHQIDHRVTP